MRTRPADLEDADVVAALADGWRMSVRSTEHVPEGGGGHHWKVTDRRGASFFVTADDLDDKDWLGETRDDVFTGLQRALQTAAALHRQRGLGFVAAPALAFDDRTAYRMSARYAVSVYPFLRGRSYPFGPYVDAQLRQRVLDMLIAVHCATSAVSDVALSHRPTVGRRRALEAAVDELGRPWDGGPFSERARARLNSRAADLVQALHTFDRLADATSTAGIHPVITHGEPHPGNVMSVDGRLVLIDWDTAALGPPERDLWMVAPTGGRDLARYEAATGRTVDNATLMMYGLRWELDDIASATAAFRQDHRRTADTQRAWATLTRQTAGLGSWPARIATLTARAPRR